MSAMAEMFSDQFMPKRQKETFSLVKVDNKIYATFTVYDPKEKRKERRVK